MRRAAGSDVSGPGGSYRESCMPRNFHLRRLARLFRDLLKDETVPERIPPAVPWNHLEKKRKVSAKVKSIRGKLNVPRERFHLTSDGRYLWAGNH